MEQIGPLFVLGAAQLAAVLFRQKRKLSEREYSRFRKRVVLCSVIGGFVSLVVLDATGVVGGLSARVRSLFVPHTHTGNPLVDSVAEHQATQGDVYLKVSISHIPHTASLIGPITLTVYSYTLRETDTFFFIVSVLRFPRRGVCPRRRGRVRGEQPLARACFRGGVFFNSRLLQREDGAFGASVRARQRDMRWYRHRGRRRLDRG
jgi:hypothetical protein